MRIEIIARNYKISDHLKDIIEKKMDKFSRYFEDEAIAKVILKEINKDKYAMEITINFSGGRIMRSEVISDNMYDNIDLALPKLERQVRKFRTKLGKKVKESGFEAESIYVEIKQEPSMNLARTKQTECKRMDIKEAIEEMQLLDHAFYVFVNTANESVNIVYKREAGGVGLLDLIY